MLKVERSGRSLRPEAWPIRSVEEKATGGLRRRDALVWTGDGGHLQNEAGSEQDGGQLPGFTLQFIPIMPPSKKSGLVFHATAKLPHLSGTLGAAIGFPMLRRYKSVVTIVRFTAGLAKVVFLRFTPNIDCAPGHGHGQSNDKQRQ